MQRNKQDSSKYDWMPNNHGNCLIYTGRQKSRDSDPGIFRLVRDGSENDVLMQMYRKGLLEGQALKDAQVYAETT